MKISTIAVWGISLVALLFSSCTQPTQPKGGGGATQTSTVSGVVIRSDDLSKVPNVIVYDTRGTAPPDTTKSDGSFRITYQLTAQYSGTLVASRVTFGSDSISFTLPQGANDTLPRSLVLKADTSSQKTSASSGIVASIVLVGGGDATNISIRGTGFTESTLLTFEARDSLGVPVGGISRAMVYFQLLGGPGGGEYLFPANGYTDLTGRISTRITSGTKAGVVQVYAFAKPDTTNPNFYVKSSPVRLTISGGLPDPAHFSMSAQKINIAGLSLDNIRDNISVVVGDKNGNPVQSGTALYFSTTGGIIQPSATTDKDGLASVNLISANPRPANGQVLVTATTIGDSGAIVSRTGRILFSGPPIILGPASGFQIADSGAYNFSYKVSDANGNPLSSGTTITVTKDGPGSGDLDLKGAVSTTMGDTQDTSLTVFNVQVQDKSRGGASGQVTFTITVSGDNGSTSYSWKGTQLAQGVALSGSSTGFAAGIELLATSTNSVSVRGTGAQATAILAYVVKDSLGNPITDTRAVTVTFTIQNGPGGGEYVFPTSGLTDATGHVSTAVTAGTKSGVVQVVASALVNGVLVIKSSPVQLTIASGLADVNHSGMWSDFVNYPLLSTNASGKKVGTISVQLGDIYNNPAQKSAVYFTTNGGLITATALTGPTGLASADLIAGGQGAPGGIDTITSITQGNQNITQYLVVTASGAPLISVPAYPSGNLPSIADGGFLTFTIDVKDINNNPLAAGNTINVTVSGDQNVIGQITTTMNGSAASATTKDTRDTSTVHYQLKLADSQPNAGGGGPISVNISVAGPNGTATKTLNGFMQAPGVISTGGGGGSGTGYISSIVLASVSSTDISVQGTGNVETATLVFQGKDSLGQNVDQPHGSMMHFSISAPTLGATLTIDSMQTDASGRATTLVNSGTISGVIQIQAKTTTPTGQSITSLPVRLSINSGLPDQKHFTIGAHELNFPGMDLNSDPINSYKPFDQITVQMGDKYGNPVAKGTVAYFTSTSGVIQTQSATSDVNGFISMNLYAGNPRPVSPNTTYMGPGWDLVYATTYDQNGAPVSDTVKVLWTGLPIITVTGGPATYNLAPGASAGPWTFTVKDRFGNPLSGGTTVVVAGPGVSVSGQSNVILPDVQAGGSGITNFTVSIQNSNAGPGALSAPVSGILMITVGYSGNGLSYTLPLATGSAN